MAFDFIRWKVATDSLGGVYVRSASPAAEGAIPRRLGTIDALCTQDNDVIKTWPFRGEGPCLEWKSIE
jgi:hypothetical protein